MARGLVSAMVVVSVLQGCLATAQPSAGGSIHGVVCDVQNANVPGVTIVMTSPDAPGAYEAVTDSEATYRFTGLQPGAYTLRASLPGFATLEQKVIIRAGVDVALDLTLQVGAFTETIEVRRDPPLLESTTARQAVNISGELQRRLPLSDRRRGSDVLLLTPGVVSSEGFGSDPLFSVHGSDQYSHVTELDGVDMGSVGRSSPTSIQFNTDLIQDVQVTTAANDASAPLGLGAIINVATRSGTNDLRGAFNATFQPKRLNDRNSMGTSATVSQEQVDLSGGGPLRRDRAWWFAAYRRQRTHTGVARTPAHLEALAALAPGFSPFDNVTSGDWYFVKPSLRISAAHTLSAQVQQDESFQEIGVAAASSPPSRRMGGPGASARWSSLWSGSLTTQVTIAWNRKTSVIEPPDSLDQPFQAVYENTVASGPRLIGTGVVAYLGAPTSLWHESPDERFRLSADATYHRSGTTGSHQVQVGLALEPRLRAETTTFFANEGFILEDLVLAGAGDLTAPLMPFHRQVYDALQNTDVRRDTRDVAVYLQDTWRPVERLTISGGVRIDWIHRRDRLCEEAGFPGEECITQHSTDIGPRFGINHLLTSDGRTRMFGHWGRVHEAQAQSAVSVAARSPGLRDLYDLDLNGTFDTVFESPGRTAIAPDRLVDSEWHQPYVNELTAGLSRQLAGSATVTASATRREYRDRAVFLETNGLYDGGVFRGYEDQSLNEVYALTNNRWNWPVVSTASVTLTRQTASLQLIASYARQWRRLEGTWQPRDPASFIQPTAFPNSRGIGSTRGSTTSTRDASSLSGQSMTDENHWRDHVLRMGVSWVAPWQLLLAASYVFQSGLWSGPVVTRLEAPDPQFGPPTLDLPNGRLVSNPLATQIRFGSPTRDEGQLRTEGHHTVNLRVGREFRFKGTQMEISADVFNLFNAATDLLFEIGANQMYSPSFGALRSRQSPRIGQLALRLAF
ncbi:MAG: TonB-dependent receptor domain-containing protein [Vicinamibacteraceae bacterium]